VLAKRAGESTAHVILKAIAYARFAPDYPDLRIEVPIGLRYKPDLVSLDEYGVPRLWVECGQVDRDKVRWLLRHYRQTRIVWLRRYAQMMGALAIVRDALGEIERDVPVEILGVTDETMLAVIEHGDADRAADAVTEAKIPDTDARE
jgi:hypothetical protein